MRVRIVALPVQWVGADHRNLERLSAESEEALVAQLAALGPRFRSRQVLFETKAEGVDLRRRTARLRKGQSPAGALLRRARIRRESFGQHVRQDLAQAAAVHGQAGCQADVTGLQFPATEKGCPKDFVVSQRR